MKAYEINEHFSVKRSAQMSINKVEAATSYKYHWYIRYQDGTEIGARCDCNVTPPQSRILSCAPVKSTSNFMCTILNNNGRSTGLYELDTVSIQVFSCFWKAAVLS